MAIIAREIRNQTTFVINEIIALRPQLDSILDTRRFQDLDQNQIRIAGSPSSLAWSALQLLADPKHWIESPHSYPNERREAEAQLRLATLSLQCAKSAIEQAEVSI